MQLVERHIIKKYNQNWKQIDVLCFLSKNLYNSSLYRIKKILEETGKFTRYYELEKIFKEENQENYIALPIQSSQQCMMQVDNQLKTYFSLIKIWKSDKKNKLKTCPKLPKYKDKNGRNIIIFTNQQCKIKNGYIQFPKRTNLLKIKTNQINLRQVRIIPKSNYYVIEVVYEKKEKEIIKNNNVLSIDFGLNNLLTCYDNVHGKPFIINGKPIKAMNQYYNKKKGEKQSKIKKNHNKNWCNSLSILTTKRNNKINDYLHKSSKYVVDYCVKNKISNIIAGYNKEWKQEINIGKVNNQNFVNIPFDKLICMLKYKCQLNGITIKLIDESYTSKCSALDLEEIKKHKTYTGKRIKRGLFKNRDGKLINADVNGSLNIGRKELGDVFIPTDIGFVFNPIKINLYKI